MKLIKRERELFPLLRKFFVGQSVRFRTGHRELEGQVVGYARFSLKVRVDKYIEVFGKRRPGWTFKVRLEDLMNSQVRK